MTSIENIQNCNSREIKETTRKAQKDFIKQVVNGVKPEDAFVSTIKKVKNGEKFEEDTNDFSASNNLHLSQGIVSQKQQPLMSVGVSAAQIRTALELIELAIPVLTSTKDFIVDLIDTIKGRGSGKEDKTKEAA